MTSAGFSLSAFQELAATMANVSSATIINVAMKIDAVMLSLVEPSATIMAIEMGKAGI